MSEHHSYHRKSEPFVDKRYIDAGAMLAGIKIAAATRPSAVALAGEQGRERGGNATSGRITSRGSKRWRCLLG